MSAHLTRMSILTGKIATLHFPQFTQEEFERRLAAWERREFLIQEAFPELSADEREFILSGITPVEWNEEFGGN